MSDQSEPSRYASETVLLLGNSRQVYLKIKSELCENTHGSKSVAPTGAE